ncbi:response regulator [Desertivirga brevis]|uniref:response regulator n=1 Tax=Desertivirga brevis TaxID=2810310 RepID=UPI001A964340|nr:response regulator [Pedobacter sp. SYSU D00873]
MQERIVVVEDDELIRETIILLLEHWHYEVNYSATGEDLVELINEFQPHLILLDIQLGELNGRDLCRELKQHPLYHTIPIIIMSGEEDLYNSIPWEGANDVILKPFDEKALISRIERQLSNSKHVPT